VIVQSQWVSVGERAKRGERKSERVREREGEREGERERERERDSLEGNSTHNATAAGGAGRSAPPPQVVMQAQAADGAACVGSGATATSTFSDQAWFSLEPVVTSLGPTPSLIGVCRNFQISTRWGMD